MNRNTAGTILGIILAIAILGAIGLFVAVNVDTFANTVGRAANRMDLSEQAPTQPAPTVAPTQPAPTVAPTQPAPTAAPTQAPLVINLDNIEMIIDALSEEGMRLDSGLIFGDTWRNKTGAVQGTLPDEYNVAVISSDPATYKSTDITFNNGSMGWLAIVIDDGNFQIQNVGYSEVNKHRNVSSYALSVDLDGDELSNFVTTLTAFEWSKEQKPRLFVVLDGEIYSFNIDTVAEDINDEGALKALLDEVFNPAN